MKKALIALFALAIATLISASVNADEPTYTIACEPTFPPFEMLDKTSGNITGFDIELIKAIGKDQGFNVDVKSMSFDGLIPAVLTGKLDMSISGFTITPKRAKVINFSDPYIDAGIGVLVAANSDIKSLDDLQGKIVAVQLGSSGQKAAEDLKKKEIIKEVKVMNNAALAVSDLITGRVDGVVNDIPVNNAYARLNKGKITTLKAPLNSEQYGIVIPKNNPELLKKVNAGLKNIKANGIYDKIYDKYFKTK